MPPCPSGEAYFSGGPPAALKAAFAGLAGVILLTVGRCDAAASEAHPALPCPTGLHVVRVAYAEALTTLEPIADAFWAAHDATLPPLRADQISAILVTGTRQRALAEEARDRLQLSGRLLRPIATLILDAGRFLPDPDGD